MNKRTIATLTTLGMFLAFALGAFYFGSNHNFAVTAQAQESEISGRDGGDGNGCRLRDLRGSYGIFANGTVVTPPPGVPAGPFATVGRMVVNADGTATVDLTRSFNGTITREVLPGTLTVEADCTGTLTFGGVRTFDFVAVDNLKELQFIQTNPGTVVTVIAKRQ
jgi:hypothetical protein